MSVSASLASPAFSMASETISDSYRTARPSLHNRAAALSASGIRHHRKPLQEAVILGPTGRDLLKVRLQAGRLNQAEYRDAHLTDRDGATADSVYGVCPRTIPALKQKSALILAPFFAHFAEEPNELVAPNQNAGRIVGDDFVEFFRCGVHRNQTRSYWCCWPFWFGRHRLILLGRFFASVLPDLMHYLVGSLLLPKLYC